MLIQSLLDLILISLWRKWLLLQKKLILSYVLLEMLLISCLMVLWMI